MLAEVGVDYPVAYWEEERLGTFVRKETVDRKMTEEELSRIPEDKRPLPDLFGDVYVKRSVVRDVSFGRPLDDMLNRKEVLFGREDPVFKPC